MCGISILINKKNEAIPTSFMKNMNAKVVHRGPDGEGFYFGENFAFGHRRLSVIDLSEGGHQPMKRNEDYLVFNGMIYNYIELKSELASLGHQFVSTSDTEVLLASCQQWGLSAFDKFNGMWAFAWYRAASNDIIMCRDRFGIKPLYYTVTGNTFAAASEIKQFQELPGFKPTLNKQSTIDFLTHGKLNYSDKTFFDGVHELRGGYYLHYNLATHDTKLCQWYDLAKVAVPHKIKMEEAVLKLREIMLDSIKIRMRSDVKVGSCLSGGIDSSAMISYLHANNLTTPYFTTVTSCFDNKRYDEQEFSDVVTDHTGFKSIKVFPNLQEMFDEKQLDEMIWFHDQPFSGASHFSEFAVFKIAGRNNLTVMLDGQGADEYFCGYNEFFIEHLQELLQTGNYGELVENIRCKYRHQKPTGIHFIKNYFQTTIAYPFISKAKAFTRMNKFKWLSNEWCKLADVKWQPMRGVRNLSLNQMVFSSLPMQLHSEDRNSMRFSIETRLPYLDHRLVEFVIGLPATFKIKKGFSKYILREAITELPEKIKNRTTKMGFEAPDEPWIRQNKERVRRELIKAVETTDIFSHHLVERFDKFINYKLGYEPIYFRAMALTRFINLSKMQAKLVTMSNILNLDVSYS